MKKGADHYSQRERRGQRGGAILFPLSLLSLVSLYIIFILFSGTFTFLLKRDSRVVATSRIKVRSVTRKPFVKNGAVHTLQRKKSRSIALSQLIESPFVPKAFLAEHCCFPQETLKDLFELEDNRTGYQTVRSNPVRPDPVSTVDRFRPLGTQAAQLLSRSSDSRTRASDLCGELLFFFTRLLHLFSLTSYLHCPVVAMD